MKLLFCGGYSQTMISVLRSMGRKGHRIDVALPLSAGKFRIARWFASKFVCRQFRVAHPLVQAEVFQEQLLQLVHDGGYDAVIPIDQRMAVWIALQKHTLSQFTHVVSPDWLLFETLHDKSKLHQLLARNGFAIPRLYTYETLEALLLQDIHFPVVLKPRKAAGSMGLRYAANRSELVAAHREISSYRSPCPCVEDYCQPLVQEYIPGKIHDGFFACQAGNTRAAMTAVRSATYPITGGFTVAAVTTLAPKLTDYCQKILAFLRYDGLCNVEVKQDERDGTYKLLEINPRVWGALELSIRAGIDFVEKACELAIWGETSTQMDYRVGLKHWIPQRELMALHQDKGHRWQRMRQWSGLFNRDTVCGIDLTDWKPELAELVSTVRLFTRKQNHLLPVGRTFTVEQCQQIYADSQFHESPVVAAV